MAYLPNHNGRMLQALAVPLCVQVELLPCTTLLPGTDSAQPHTQCDNTLQDYSSHIHPRLETRSCQI